MGDLTNKHERYADYVKVTQTGLHKRIPRLENRREPINLAMFLFDLFVIATIFCAVATLRPEWLRLIWDFVMEGVRWLTVLF